MALQALSRNYHTRRDIPYPANSSQLELMRSFVWLLKGCLRDQVSTGTTGANSRHANSIWTHVSSCDSSTTSSGSDLWGATYTNTALVWAADGAAHSWWVGQNTTLGVQICIDLQNATNTNILISMTPISQPFTGGSTTSRPTNASYEVNLGYNTYNLSNFIAFQADTTTGNTNYAQFTCADDGSFYILGTRQTLGWPTCALAIQKTATSTDWPASGSDANRVLLMRFAPTVASPGPFVHDTVANDPSYCAALLPNNTRANQGGFMKYVFGGVAFPNSELPQDVYTSAYPCLPLAVLQWRSSGGITQTTLRGVVPDWWIHPNRTQIFPGQTNDPGGVISHIATGDFFLPWNGSAGPTL